MEGQYVLLRSEVNKGRALEIIESLPINESNPWGVQFVPEGDRRTLIQNSYLWGWLYHSIAKALSEAGIAIPMKDGATHPYDKDILHEIFGKKFRKIGEIVAKNGNTLDIIQSTTKMGKKRFAEYCDEVEGFAWDFWEIRIPPTVGIYKDYERELRSRG